MLRMQGKNELADEMEKQFRDAREKANGVGRDCSARARANREVARMLDKAVEVCTEAQFTAAEEWLVLCLQTRHRDEAEDVIRWLRSASPRRAR